ncbi:PREDICTED: uncharacterized protein LOC109344549 [Lupinus angustifolius]|uniref:uncharacterized protein LOC109344549 n=1 Tax=Lupinus angustifolius TaxID=3871 RepID=UPI00092E4D8E|nr:PREDICTED: uncharacterized protein LOC109344549 [Lupinus angustifolius]
MGQTGFPANLPILDGNNWNKLRIQMSAIMGFQEVSEIVEDGIADLTTEAQRVLYKESKKKDCKAMFLLHQCVDEAHFEKIVEARSTKEAWEILKKSNEGAEQLKKVRLQTMRIQYELMSIEPSERIAQYFNRVTSHTNAMKAKGEKMADQIIVEKILRTPSPKFDYIVIAIEESKKIDELKIVDLQGSLEAHEQRILERSTEKPIEQALQAQTTRRGGYGNRGGQRSRGRGKDQRRGNFRPPQFSDQERSKIH